MGKVLEFPSNRAQGMAYLEAQLRRMLVAKGADDNLIDFATSQLTDIYGHVADAEQYNFSVQLPAGLSEEQQLELHAQISEGLESMRRENHSLMLELSAQLLLTRMHLYQQQQAD